MADIASSFVGALEPEVREASESEPTFAETIAEVPGRLADAQQQYPRVRVAAQAFAAHVAGQIGPDQPLDEQLDRLELGDLYLAFACAQGDREALQSFERTFGGDLTRAVTKVGSRSHGADDLGQRVREKLFVHDGERPPRIAAYGGRGSLRAWVRVTAVRTVLDIVRWGDDSKRKVDMDRDVLEAIPGAAPDPELDVLRQAHGKRLTEAMRSAFEALTSRQRNLLRQRFLHGLSTEQVAKLYGVHRATAFRWLEAARASLFEGTRGRLRDELGVSGRELESIIGAMRSRIDVSIGGLLDQELEPE